MLNAVLMLLEQQMAVPEQEKNPFTLNIEDTQPYEKQFQSSNYHALFVETVPDDVKNCEAGSSNLHALSQAVHRLKGVFAMLNLLPGKQLCESLKQHITNGDTCNIGNNIS